MNISKTVTVNGLILSLFHPLLKTNFISCGNLYFSFQGSQIIQLRINPPVDKTGKESPIVSFIRLERYNAVKLVQSIHHSLAALSKIIRGTQLLTKEVQNLAAALLNQEVRRSGAHNSRLALYKVYF